MKKLMFITTFFLASCGMAEKHKITGNYYLVAVDTDDEMALAYHEPSDGSNYATIVDNCVFAVGYNDKYIIAKQHPWNFMSSKRPNKEVTNYYIVPIGSIYIPNNKPLNEFQFDQERKRLGIENIQFTIVYKDLE
jgi:hypothetical protein